MSQAVKTAAQPANPARLQWGRIVAGALLVEIALMIVFVPLLAFTQAPWLMRLIAVGCFVFGFVISRWMVRKVRSRPVLHGALIGVLATVIYLGLCLAAPGGIGPVIEMYGPFLFVLGNGLRIAGCMAGGLALRQPVS